MPIIILIYLMNYIDRWVSSLVLVVLLGNTG